MLALCVALVGPYFVDWTSYRADFEREASAVLGRKVTVEGSASARLLPFPSVTFTDVVVGGKAGEPAMTVETFSMDAELAPFLRGEVLIFDMRLVRPKARLEIADDGTVNWMVRPSTPFDARQVTLEKLTITEGQVEIARPGGRNHAITEVNGTVSARTLAGPWRGEGTLRFDGMLAAVSASTGTREADGAIRLRVNVAPNRWPLGIETDGNVSIQNGAPVYAATFRVNEKKAEPASVGAGTAAVDPGFRLKGDLTLGHERLKVDSFRFETGPLDNPYVAEGTAALEIGAEPRFSVSMKGAQMRFDEAVAGDQTGGGLMLSERIAALQDALEGLPRPTIPGTIEVDLPAVVAGDTTVRDVTLSAEPSATGWSLKSLAATLPGRTRLEAKGELAVEGTFGFNGSLLVAVAQPSGFAAWVAREVDDAVRRLPAAGFSAKVQATRDRQHFSDLELVLGSARFTGELDRQQKSDKRPTVLLTLAGGALDLDGLQAFASLFVSDSGATRFTEHDIDLQLKAGPVSAAGLSAETVDTALRLREHAVEIDRLSIGGLAGASISATGTISDFPDSPTGRLDGTIVATDLAPLIAVAAERYPQMPVLSGLKRRAAAYQGLFDNAELNLIASAADNGDGTIGLAVSAKGVAGGTEYAATLSGSGARGALASAPLTAELSAKNPDATALLALLGVPVSPLGLLGAGEATLSLKGASTDLATKFALASEGFDAGFDGSLALAGEGLTLRGKAKLNAEDIEPWLLTAAMSMPGSGLGTSVQLDADADYGNGLLVLNSLQGAVGEGAVSGDVNLTLKDGLPHVTGTLALDELDLEPLAGAVLGAAALAGDGEGLWPDTPFAPAQTLPFTAELDLTSGEIGAGPLAAIYDASLSLRLDGDGLGVSNLKGNLDGGTVSGLFNLKNTEGTGLLSAQLKLDGAQLTALAPASRLGGRGDFSAEVSGSGKSVGGLVTSLAGSGTARLTGLEIPGLNQDAFAGLIADADRAGRDIDAAKVSAFAPALAAAGRFPAGDAEIAYTVAGGVLRAPATSFPGEGATVTTDLRIDIATGEMGAEGNIAWKPGDEALTGSEPVMRFSLAGPLGAPAAKFDTEPLAQFLTQRALEIEQARVDAMQTSLLEKQRLRREVRYYAALQDERRRLADEARRAEEERLRAEEERQRAEAEARAKAEAEARAKAEAEAKAKLEAEEKAKADAEAKQRAEEQKRIDRQREIDDAKRREEEAQRLLDEADAAEAEWQRQQDAERAATDRQARRQRDADRAARASEADNHPVPPADVGKPAPGRKIFDPFSLDGFLKSLQ